MREGRLNSRRITVIPPISLTTAISLVEALTLLHLKELKHEVTIVAAGILLVTAGWLLFSWA